MAKDGFMTAKAIGNRIKAKGLQKLRWYCQICEKQCRDENGFKCHCASESHQRKILLVAESPEKYVNDYSAEFLKDFMKLLSTRYGTRRVNANLVYQEFIADRTHLHMNATKWASLSEFTMHLGKEGLAIVDETPKGWFMQWIDNSPKTLARQEAILKKERMELDDEQREQRLIQQQIDKAMALKQQQDEADGVTTELVRENEEEKIKLDISIKPVGLTGGIGGGIKLGGGLGGGLLKPKSLNALAAAKKPNPFSSKSGSTPTTVSGNGSAVTPALAKKRSPVEEIMEREMAKKRRLEELAKNSNNNNINPSQSTSGGGGRATQQPEQEKDRTKESSRDDRDNRDYRSSRDSRDSRDTRDRERERDRDYRSSRDDRDDRDREYRSSRDSRDDRDRDRERDYRSSRDDRDRDTHRSSRDSRDDRDRSGEHGPSSRDSRSDRDYRDRSRDRDGSYRDRGRD
ncbi:hypothetical protein BGZ96_002937 [Linnemannia gamsii]|uniref:DNA/RNA-binding protein Kin17 WH-like domain-containing protein n=1 Tax=Linnemannia gamsii TaxID=64522 RepID=A0ABQ7K8U1_9FUNG|nr:hypothetical protein BGZ96_002937 [Linnemannia gamsii]